MYYTSEAMMGRRREPGICEGEKLFPPEVSGDNASDLPAHGLVLASERRFMRRKQPCDSSPDPSDDALVQRSLAGDHAAFAALVERYHAQLEGYIAHWCADKSVISDIVQHVLLQLYVSLPTLRADPSLKAWLLRVAHNRCVDERRHSRLVPFSRLTEACDEEDLPPSGSNRENQLYARQTPSASAAG
jgi:hypothetical protein